MVQIAGLEVGLPASIEQVDPAWLTSVLQTSGALGEDGAVRSVSAETFAVGVGFLSDLHRVELTYDGDHSGAPATVIVKMATGIEGQRGIADALSFYQRELRFYREIAPIIDIATPKVHAALMSEDNTDFVLVMQDMSSLRSMDQQTGVSASDAHLAVSGLAKLHARFWGADLSDLQSTFLPFDNPIYRAALPLVFEGGWERAKAVASDLLSDDLISFGDRFGSLVPFFVDSIDGASTLIHGDWRADNLLVDNDGGLVALDFQIVGTGTATYDLGYFMSQSVEPEVRRESAQAVVDTYFNALSEAGIEYDRESLERIYRLAMAWCLIYPVATIASWDELPGQAQQMARAMLRRSVTAIVDNDCLSLIPD